ncbi:thermonuclease family protein [Candidatus Parcubacteria bacterium]|nr:thermonuclease family protein [Candidatus Parcubacteria bacterium]
MKIKLKLKNNFYYLGLVFVILVGLLWLAHPLAINAPGADDLLPVVQIYDGDTIVVLLNGQRESVRLLGIDTPEVESPYTKVECFGQEASEFVKNLLLNQKVRLVPDPVGNDHDKYERLLRYVYLNDTDINAQLLTKGYAYLLDTFPFSRIDEYRALEEAARENTVGLWQECEEK